jgi:hypothetical protein
MDRWPGQDTLSFQSEHNQIKPVFQAYFYGLVAHTSCIVFLRKMDAEKKDFDQSLIHILHNCFDIYD